MHDLLLGVLWCDMALLLRKIFQETSLTLQDLNDDILCFDFGIDNNSKPTLILKKHLDQLPIQMYAAQMLTFVKYLPVLIGTDIPIESNYWDWFLTVRKLIF